MAGLTEIAAHPDKFTAAGADVLASPKNAPLRCSNTFLVRAGDGRAGDGVQRATVSSLRTSEWGLSRHRNTRAVAATTGCRRGGFVVGAVAAGSGAGNAARAAASGQV